MPIYARTSGGVYKAISKILTADGREIGKVVDSTDRIIYEASRLITVTGVPPISFTKSIGKPLVSWDLLGNAQQTGTPSPDNIIMPTFCGVRTGSLINPDSVWSSRKVSDGVYRGTIQRFYSSPFYMPESLVGKTVTAKCYISGNLNGTNIRWRFASNGSSKDSSSLSSDGYITLTFTISSSSDNLRIYYGSGSTREITITKFMVNEGSTALPYEPYGYKIPFNDHGDNLFDKTTATIDNRVTASGTTYNESVACTDYINIEGLSEITVSSKPNVTNIYFYSSKTANADSYVNNFSATIPDSAKYVRVNFPKNDLETFMLNSGSTPKPYSPYFSETVPVYLGQTQTVRKVKKLVLDGTESWEEGTANYYIYINTSNRGEGVPYLTSLSTHTERGIYVNNTGHALFFKKVVFVHSSLADFKSYLAAQYAAGTPVTVWYALATPETSIVNEPLAKIGDYADELHSTDTAVTIPTTKGNNTLTVDTDLPPSSMTIVYKGRHDSGS